MPWTPPSDPITSTVITVAYAVANLLTQIRWLRGMTGNADPPASNYVVVSDTTSTTSWRKVPADALATGAIAGNLGYTPANKAGEVFGPGTVSVPYPLTLAALGGATGGGVVFQASGGFFGAGMDVAASTWRLYNANDGSRTIQFGLTTGVLLASHGVTAPVLTSTVGTGTQPLAITSQTEVANLNAQFVGGYAPGNGTNQIPISNSVANAGLIAASATTATTAATATNATQVGGRTPTATPTANAIPISDGTGKLAGGWLPAASGDAASVTGHVPTATPAPGALPLANPSGRLDDWVTPSVAGATVPTGLIAMFEDTNPANMPSGWSRYTAGDGRIIVGAGTSASQTFTSTTNYGTAWSHTHSDSGHGHGSVNHNHGASALSVAGHTGTASASTPSVNVTSGAGGETYVPDHTHDASSGGGTLDVAGATDSTTTLTVPSGAASMSTDTWLPMMRSLMYIRKN